MGCRMQLGRCCGYHLRHNVAVRISVRTLRGKAGFRVVIESTTASDVFRLGDQSGEASARIVH